MYKNIRRVVEILGVNIRPQDTEFVQILTVDLNGNEILLVMSKDNARLLSTDLQDVLSK